MRAAFNWRVGLLRDAKSSDLRLLVLLPRGLRMQHYRECWKRHTLRETAMTSKYSHRVCSCNGNRHQQNKGGQCILKFRYLFTVPLGTKSMFTKMETRMETLHRLCVQELLRGLGGEFILVPAGLHACLHARACLPACVPACL